jgi:hypothetical protein
MKEIACPRCFLAPCKSDKVDYLQIVKQKKGQDEPGLTEKVSEI